MKKKTLSNYFYNIVPDLPKLLSSPKDKDGKLINKPEDFSLPICQELKKQEFSQERKIIIPKEVLEFYQRYRPTPLARASCLESFLKTPAKIFYKNEGLSLSGNHKLNTAIVTVYYAKKEGFKQIISGMNTVHSAFALGIAGNYFGVKIKVFLPQKNLPQNSLLATFLKMLNVEVVTVFDKNLSEILTRAVNEVKKTPKSVYAICSFLNHTLCHQTIIGQEAKKQMGEMNLQPDIIIGCCGGGSNFGGIIIPFLKSQFQKGRKIRFVAVEPDVYPSLARGKYAYHFVDQNTIFPQFMMYSYPTISNPGDCAGGLKFHGVSPILSLLYNLGYIESRTCNLKSAFDAAQIFFQKEGIIPAPESAYAIKVAIDEAKQCRISGQKRTILFNLSGHGMLDLNAYSDFLDGKLE